MILVTGSDILKRLPRLIYRQTSRDYDTTLLRNSLSNVNTYLILLTPTAYLHYYTSHEVTVLGRKARLDSLNDGYENLRKERKKVILGTLETRYMYKSVYS